MKGYPDDILTAKGTDLLENLLQAKDGAAKGISLHHARAIVKECLSDVQLSKVLDATTPHEIVSILEEEYCANTPSNCLTLVRAD